MSNVKILAIDTTTEACSAALMINNTIKVRFAITPNKHTKYILPMIDSLLDEANISLWSIDVLAFGRGPGSFTGIRIAISIAQGLALGAGLPLIEISSLAILAQGVWRNTGSKNVLCTIDASKDKLYLAKYYRKEDGIWIGTKSELIINIKKIELFIADMTGNWTIAGTGFKIYKKLLNIKNDKLHFSTCKTIFPSAQDILPLALQKWNTGKVLPVDKVNSIYL